MDDLRDLGNVKTERNTQLDSDALGISKMICNHLVLESLDLRNFEDPSIQRFYALLQARALDEKLYELPQDQLMPDEDGFESYKELIALFEKSVRLSSNDNQPKPSKEQKPKQQRAQKQSIECRKDGAGRYWHLGSALKGREW